ncbi:MAG: peptidoglycan-associated lipoprotein Pal [Paracoccaceae bacterium]|jgi:peptidoglycan-associated lipoprotein
MNFLGKGLLLLTALALAGCNSPGRGIGSGGVGGEIETIGLGSPADPTSPSYFQGSVGDRVFFEVDQTTLTAQERDILNQQASWLQGNANYNIVIEGHADEQGTREYNLALGARRASSVQDYLTMQGITPSRMRTVSYGKERPVEICSIEECYARNRRSVTVLTK